MAALVLLPFILASDHGTGARKEAKNVPSRAGAAAFLEGQTCVEKLAHLFPHASPVRIAVRVSTVAAATRRLHEETVVEFGTAREVLFSSALPLEFEDRVRLVNSDGSFDAQATVVAVRYHGGQKAVAARFVGDVENWIVKP